MGQSTDQTVRQIDDTRERLGAELRDFEDRLPDRLPTARQTVLPIAGAVLATGTAWLVIRGVRRRARAKAAATKFPARVLARVLPKTARSSKMLDGETWKLWATAAGGIWVAFRVAEIRQLRRLNRTLVVR